MSYTKGATHGAYALSFICSIDRPYNPISHYMRIISHYIAYMRLYRIISRDLYKTI